MNAQLLLLHALSPVHAGTGQSLGAIDLAIARDRATDAPYIPGSSIKGTLRALCDEAKDKGKATTKKIFGPETPEAAEQAGAVAFGDANLLLLPVRSVAGTFAWVTSPFILARFARDAREAGLKEVPTISDMGNIAECRVCPQTRLKAKVGGEERVVFEDLDLNPKGSPAQPWADFLGKLLFPGDEFWQTLLQQKLCIVHDDIMTFLGRHAVDIAARIRMEPDTKTVAKGGLWYEENLPAEAILYSLTLAMPNGKTGLTAEALYKHLNDLIAQPIQLGGNATVGRGRCRARFATGGSK